jgi:arylsulfatase A-like enzyme
MDHGGLLHGHTFFDELIRVPLLVRGPGVPAGLRVPAQVRSLDVAATLLAWAGLATSDLDGEPLLPHFGAGGAPDRPALSYRSARYVALRTPEWKLVAAFEPYPDPGLGSLSPAALVRNARVALVRPKRDEIGLFDLKSDPAESRDLLGSRGAEGARLDALLRGELAASPLLAVPTSVARGPSDETVDRLRALGYTD